MTLDTLSERQRWRSLAVVIGEVFGVGVAFGALVPLLTLRLERDGVDTVLIGINTAMFPIAVLAIGAFLPRIIARLGTLPSMWLGLAISGAATMLFPLLPGLVAWFVLRFAIGAASAIHWVVSETWMNTMASERNRGRVMGLYSAVLAGGFTVGPLIIGAVGIDGWAPFAIVVAALGLSAVPLLIARRLAPPMPERQPAPVARFLRGAPFVMLAALVGGVVDTALYTLLPVYALQAGMAPSAAVLTLGLFIAGNVALQYPLGVLADRGGRSGILLMCAAVEVLGAVLLPVLSPGGLAPSAPLLWAMLFVWGGTSFGVYTIGLSLLGERFPRAALAGANTAFIMTYEVGSVTGPIAAGGAMDLLGRDGLTLVVALAAGALLACALPLLRRRRS